MAEVDVKKASSKEQQTQGQQGLQRQQGSTGLARRGSWDPFNLSLISSDLFNLNPFTASPFSLMRRMSDEMDRMFASAFTGAGTSGAGAGAGAMTAWAPAIEVKERNNQLEISADLPGLSKDDVKVEVTDDAVILQGERKWEREEEKGGIHRSERRYGQFYRAIPIPEGANPEQAKADFKDGVLRVTIPVPEQKSNRRQIPIEAPKT